MNDIILLILRARVREKEREIERERENSSLRMEKSKTSGVFKVNKNPQNIGLTLVICKLLEQIIRGPEANFSHQI